MRCPKKGFTTFSLHKRGFTLIELLVVISIIAILSVVGFTSFTNVQKGARDAKRKADIDSIAKAYEVKYDSDNSQYKPLDVTAFTSGNIPKDPNAAKGYYYNWLDKDKSGFRLCASLENNGNEACTTSAKYCYCKDSTQGKVKLLPIVGEYIDASAANPIYADKATTHTDLGPGSINPAPLCDTTGRLTDRLVGYWKMDNSAADLSRNDNNCTLRGNPAWAPGKFDYAIQFHAVSSPVSPQNYLDCGNQSSLTLGTDDFTISAWLYPEAWVAEKEYAYIYKKHDGTNDNGLELELKTYGTLDGQYWISSYRIQNTYPGYAQLGNSSFKINKNSWSHVVITRQGNNLKFYLDGIYYNTSTVADIGTNFNTTSNFMIGKAAWGDSTQYQGKIDDVRIYKRALTGGFDGSEISNLYNGGSGCIP